LKNRFLAQLDRRLEKRGELIELRRTVGTTNQSYVQCRIPAIVRALTVEQLIGAITQQNYFIIISPTHINKQQWPGGKTPAATGSIIQPSDPRIPLTSDAVVIRGAQKAVQRVAPVFDAGVCIRIELSVLG
jgi:hypothetical protein